MTRTIWQIVAPWIAGVYVLGLLFMMARLALAFGGNRALRRRTQPVNQALWQESLQRVMRRLNAKRAPLLKWSSEVASPAVIGLLKPVILLPVALANRLSITQAEAVLAHELAHLRRHDGWVLVVQRLVETILFYHPVVWWLSRELNRTREQACDDLVLASGSGPADYAETLVLCSELRLLKSGLAPKPAVQLAATGDRETSLRGRVLRILGQHDPIRPGKTGWWMTGGLAAILLAAGLVAPGWGEPVGDTEAPENRNPAEEPAAPDEVLADPGSTGNSDPVEDPPSEEELAANPGADPNLPGDAKNAAAIGIDVVLAEVPATFAVNQQSMSVQALRNNKQAKVINTPAIVVRSGETGAIELVARGAASHTVTISPEVVANGKKGDMVRHHILVEYAQTDGDNKTVLQKTETKSTTTWGTWVPLVVGFLDQDRKLAAAVRFTKHGHAPPLPDKLTLHLLPGGLFELKGKRYPLEQLKAVLPKDAQIGAIKATPNIPYRDLLRLMDLLPPETRDEIVLQIAEPEAKALMTDKQLPKGALDLEIALLLQEIADLKAAGLGKNHPYRKMFESELEELEKLRKSLPSDLKAGGLKQLDEQIAQMKVIELKLLLKNLQASGLGKKHPKIIGTESQLREVRALLKDLQEQSP